jgi:hypothetical protein
MDIPVPNEGQIDRALRVGVGLLSLLSGIYLFTGTHQIIALILGVLVLMTGLSGYCLIYKVLGISTN